MGFLLGDLVFGWGGGKCRDFSFSEGIGVGVFRVVYVSFGFRGFFM